MYRHKRFNSDVDARASTKGDPVTLHPPTEGGTVAPPFLCCSVLARRRQCPTSRCHVVKTARTRSRRSDRPVLGRPPSSQSQGLGTRLLPGTRTGWALARRARRCWEWEDMILAASTPSGQDRSASRFDRPRGQMPGQRPCGTGAAAARRAFVDPCEAFPAAAPGRFDKAKEGKLDGSHGTLDRWKRK